MRLQKINDQKNLEDLKTELTETVAWLDRIAARLAGWQGEVDHCAGPCSGIRDEEADEE